MKIKVNKKIFLQPHVPKDEKECQCLTCGGIGFMLEEDKWLEQCIDCYNGIVPKCEYCCSPMRRDPYSFKCTNPECNWKVYDEEKREKEYIDKEKERYEKADHYSPIDCPKESCEMYFSETYGYNDGYFYEIDELEEYCEESNIEMPKYVWGTHRNEFQLDVADWIEDKLYDSYEDAMCNVDKTELTKLQIACDKFVLNHHGCLDTFYVDYSVCIDL